MVGQVNNQTTSSPCQPVSSSTTMSGKSPGTVAVVPGATVESQKCCVWCKDARKKLEFVLPTQHGRKEVCSEICLVHFRMAYKNGNCTLCSECGCAVRSQELLRKLTHNDKEHVFCSPGCLEEYKRKHGIVSPPPPQVPPPQPPQHPSATSATPPPPQKPSLPPATKKKQHDPNSEAFTWSEYLVKTNSKPAPSSCFKQHATPPTNEFATDMKLEAIDPRNTTSTCIATVIGSVGPRIRLRLDGSDNSNDFWRSVDSHEIQPIGTCEKNKGMLQPPLGFQKNASFWPMFLCKTLNGAQMAPDNCFKVEPPTPRFNLFKVGHKLEAVDRKNPQLICVATVGAVDRDNIHITFDGWRGAFDYWCKYDSRDIFPVGWCEMAGHPLQPPGNKVPMHGPSTPSNLPSPHTPISNHHEPPTSPQPQVPPYVVTLHITVSCDCGPYVDSQKLKTIPTIIGPSNIQEVYNQFIQMLRQCALKSAPLDTLLPVQGSDLHEQGDFWVEVLALIDRFKFCENFVNDKAEDEEEAGVSVRGRSKECSKCGRRFEGVGVKVIKKRKSSGGGRERKGSGDVAEPQKKIVKEVKSAVVDPGDWDVEQVIRAIVAVDSSMELHAELFRKHEIDGKAMLLLNSDMMMRYMGLKLGPALKICNIISKFKSKNNMKNGAGTNGV